MTLMAAYVYANRVEIGSEVALNKVIESIPNRSAIFRYEIHVLSAASHTFPSTLIGVASFFGTRTPGGRSTAP